jgi:hypothetical protein
VVAVALAAVAAATSRTRGGGTQCWWDCLVCASAVGPAKGL